MFEWLTQWTTPIQEFFTSLSGWERLAVGLGLFLVMFVGSLAAVTCILIKLPPTYFADHHPPAFAEHHPVIRWLGLIAKNVLGLLLVIIGILLSLPGIPGQGLLTIVIGLMLMNFPGKRALEKKLVSRPSVLGAINGLRARFGRPPMVLEEGGERGARGGEREEGIKAAVVDQNQG
jgi:hypothetical protein